ncbi:MAG: sigma-70 family RNA polymerase sigma factor [Edaphocola sp.]
MPNNNYRNLSDEDLLHRLSVKQDQEAFQNLYQRYAHLALGLCLKYLKDTEQAKDAVQNIFLRLWSNGDQYAIRKFKPWLYQVTKNHCLMELRKKDPNQKIVAEWDLEATENDEGLHRHLSREQLLLQLMMCLRQLNNEQKSCIQYFYLHQKSYSETAELTGYEARQVKSHIQNGRRNLKNCVKQKVNN